MKTARAWLTWCGAVLVSTAVTASCGSDELVGPSDDGNVVEGGAGGEGGSGSGLGGTGGTPQRATDLGKACSDPAQCGGELVCNQSPSLPGGVCSVECATNADCTPHGPGVCDRFNRLCFESCTPGQLGLGEKCHGREDLACGFVDAQQTMNTCSETSPCPGGEVCGPQGVCFEVFMGCQPNCDSDSDCPGAFCDLGSGFCVDEEPEGLPIGAPCDPALEEDPCAGLCLGSDAETAVCSGLCRFSRTDLGCGEEPDTTHPEAACLFPPFVAPGASLGDSAFCAQLCDCKADCGNPNLDCLAFVDPDTGEQQVLVDRFGFCAAAQPGDFVIEECPSEGGAGGATGGAGEAGAAGSGGSGGAAGGAGGSAGAD